MQILKTAVIAMSLTVIALPACAWPGDELVEPRCTGTFPAIGMTKDEIRASRWGNPYDGRTLTTASGVKETWIYKGVLSADQCTAIFNGHEFRYLYFENGVLTAIQR